MFSGKVKASAGLCCVLAQTHPLSLLCKTLVYWSLPLPLRESIPWSVVGTRLLARLDLVVEAYVSLGGRNGSLGVLSIL